MKVRLPHHVDPPGIGGELQQGLARAVHYTSIVWKAAGDFPLFMNVTLFKIDGFSPSK